LQEAGEGEAEGFELAEEDLVEAAGTGVTWVEPVRAGLSAGIRGRIRIDLR
jgi:hypothetical protein